MVDFTIKRSGVIPYSVTPYGKIIFCFGLDRSGDISDWGGRIEDGETPILAAIRELKEESLGYFCLEEVELERSINIIDTTQSCSIYFVLVSYEEMINFPSQYQELKRKTMKITASIEMLSVKLLFYYSIEDVIAKKAGSIRFYERIEPSIRKSLPKLFQLVNFYK